MKIGVYVNGCGFGDCIWLFVVNDFICINGYFILNEIFVLEKFLYKKVK